MSLASSSSTPQGDVGAADRRALRKLAMFGILQLAVVGVGWVLGVVLFEGLYTGAGSVPGSNATPAEMAAFLKPLFARIAVIVPVTTSAGVVSYLVLVLALRDLTSIDRAKFRLPSVFAIVAAVGALLVGAVSFPFMSLIPDLLAQIPTSAGGSITPAGAPLISELVIYIAVIAVAGIATLAGEIGGMCLGLWRVGSRYDQTLMKVAAILVIIPLLNVVGDILVVVGAYQARRPREL